MKPTFRLAAVLRVAKLRERQAEAEAVRQEQLVREAETRVAERRRRLAEEAFRGSVDGPAPQVLDVADFEADRQRRRLQAEAVTVAEAELLDQVVRATEARNDWLATARNRKSLEKLEARDHAARAMVAARASQRSLDDLARVRRSAFGGQV